MNLEERTQHLGRELLSESKRRIPPLWSEGGQKNAFFDLCMHDPEAATEIFRFMDVFPTLSNEKVLSHVREYLLDSGVNLGVLRPVVSSAGIAPEKAVAAIHFFSGCDIARRNMVDFIPYFFSNSTISSMFGS